MFFFILSFVLSLTSCDHSAADSEILVSGKAFQIKVGEFRNYLKAEYQHYPGQVYRVSQQFSEKKERLLNQWIEHQLLLQEAEKSTMSLKEVELLGKGREEIQKIKGAYPENLFEKALKERQIKGSDWEKTQREKWLVQSYLFSKLKLVETASEEAQKDFYQKNLKVYHEKDSVHVRHILLNKKEKADQVMRRLKRGANFAKLARDFSIAPERRKGGDLGWIHREEYPREFSVCFAMNPGEISPIIPSAYGFHIFKVIEKKSSRTLKFEEVKNKIKVALRKSQAEQLKQELIKELYKKKQIKINQEVLERITL